MKSMIISILGLGAIGLLTSCTYVDRKDQMGPTTTSRTTTTDSLPTTYGTVETKTTRTY